MEMSIYSYIIVILFSMKDKNAAKAFQNLLHLNTEPLYVEQLQDTQPNNDSLNNTKKKKPFYSIFSALACSHQDAIIKIGTGLYNQNNQVKVGGLRFNANQPSSNVVLANESSPSLIIELPSREDKMHIQGIKFAHLNHSSKGSIEWPTMKRLKQTKYRSLTVVDNINTNIILKRGTLFIDQCQFSLIGGRQGGRLLASIVIQQQGILVVNRSQFIGGLNSIGIFCNGGWANIRDCTFTKHGGIGLLMAGGKDSSLILKNSSFKQCYEGIVLNGPFSCSVQNNIISQCSGGGILALSGNNGNVINNQIKYCKVGIQVQNSCTKIMKNNCIGNKQYGITCYSRLNRQCWPVLKFNVIQENKKGGIYIMGSRNRTEVCNNYVKLNQKVGIIVQYSAHPHIFLNQVNNNFGNGVHITGGATAFLQKNQISGSLNCNVVLQGPRNIDNYIYNNRIHHARGQGLLLVHCQKFLIAKNTINSNFNGVLSITSVVNLQDNIVMNNKCNGVVLLNDSYVLMSQNTFQANRVAGLIARNTSRAKIRKNKFNTNKIEALIQNSWEGMEDIQQQNQFNTNADIRTPGNMTCSLI